MKHPVLNALVATLLLQFALVSTAFAQAEFVLGGVEMESEGNVPGVLGDVDDSLEETDYEAEDGKQRSWEPVIAPIPSRNPVFGWMVAVPAMLMYKPSFAAPEDRVWISGLFGFYAENKSWGAGLMQRMSFGGDTWRVMGSLFHAEMNYRYYGIGGGGDAGRTDGKLNVVATTGPVGDVAARVGGDPTAEPVAVVAAVAPARATAEATTRAAETASSPRGSTATERT